MLLAYFWGPPHLPANQPRQPNSISATMFLLVGPCDDSDSLRFVVVERSLLCVVRDFWNTAGCVVVVFGGLTD